MTADGRMCAKDVHDRAFFNSINTNIPKALRDAGFDVADCEMYDMAEKEYANEKKKQSGQTSSQFKRKAEKDKQELEKKISECEKELKKIKGEILDTQQVAQVKQKRKLLQ